MNDWRILTDSGGIQEEHIYNSIINLLNNKNAYAKMSKAGNPYGDGNASKRIADILLEH